jgi:hypothetical protein
LRKYVAFCRFDRHFRRTYRRRASPEPPLKRDLSNLSFVRLLSPLPFCRIFRTRLGVQVRSRHDFVACRAEAVEANLGSAFGVRHPDRQRFIRALAPTPSRSSGSDTFRVSLEMISVFPDAILSGSITKSDIPAMIKAHTPKSGARVYASEAWA